MHGRCTIDLDQLEFAGQIGFVKESMRSEAGVIDQNLDSRPVARQRLTESLTILFGGQVGIHRCALDAVRRRQFSGQCGKSVHSPGNEDQVVPVRGELAGEFFADATRGASDYRDRSHSRIGHDRSERMTRTYGPGARLAHADLGASAQGSCGPRPLQSLPFPGYFSRPFPSSSVGRAGDC